MSLRGTRFLFIGGGNMAQAVLGGLRQAGVSSGQLLVVEPHEATRELLAERLGLTAVRDAAAALDAVASSAAPKATAKATANATAHATANAAIDIVVWAVKPQTYAEAVAAVGSSLAGALHLSVMAGIRSDALVRDTGSARAVRAMPNTPALIGRGISGLYARPAVSEEDRALAAQTLAATGSVVWVPHEDDLDTVTALSGSGPAYVFYVAEALVGAGVRAGLAESIARELVLGTFAGAAALAQARPEPLAALREQVTSKGGTTFAALESMRADRVGEAVARAAEAARLRAAELGRSLG